MSDILNWDGTWAMAAIGGLAAIKALSGGFRKMGASSAAAIESLTTQFKPLLDSLERAKSRMAEIQNFTASTPLRMPDVAAGAKTLETLSKGALSGEKGMRMVGDAAAVANISFAQSARTIGRLYDGLQSGRPVGEAAQRMQELSLLSGAARTKIEALQASGAAGNEVWKIAEAELRKTAGATEELSRTVEGLNSTLSDTKSIVGAAFSKGYMDGEKASLDAQIKAYEKLGP